MLPLLCYLLISIQIFQRQNLFFSVVKQVLALQHLHLLLLLFYSLFNWLVISFIMADASVR